MEVTPEDIKNQEKDIKELRKGQTKHQLSQGDIICDSAWELGKILNYLKNNGFTGTFRLEFNFYKGSISKKVKHGTIEVSELPGKLKDF